MKHSGYIITLDENINDSESEHIIKLIEYIKGVSSVKPIYKDEFSETIGANRSDAKWRSKINDLLKDI